MAVRLADLLAGLSRLADLGFGLQAGEALRSCALATRFARSLDLPDDDVRAAFYTALLHHVGCTGYAHETARLFGDELVLNAAAGRSDPADPRDLFTTFLPLLTGGRPPLERARLALTAVTRGSRFGKAYTTAACEVGRDAARRLRLPAGGAAQRLPRLRGVAGRRRPGRSGRRRPPGRVAAGPADRHRGAVRHHRRGRAGGRRGPAARRRHARPVDGRAVRGARRGAAGRDRRRPTRERWCWRRNPARWCRCPTTSWPEVAATFADLADLKTPFTHGHSSGVAALARGAGERLRLPPDSVADLEVAGLLHDVGRVAVSDVVWEKPGSLNAHEWEQVRLHAYHSERILAGSERLASLAPMVGMHHERLDGGGYHRGCTGADLSMPARTLAAADAYQAMTQPRPHRPALAPDQAEQRLLADARKGALDGDAVGAVLAAAGHAAVVPPPDAAGGAERPRGRGARPGRGGVQQRPDRPAPGDLQADGRAPRAAHLHQDRRVQPGRGGPVRDGAPPAAAEG